MLSHVLASLTTLVFLTLRATAISVPGSVPGTTSHYAKVGGHVYHYLRSRPETAPVGTILLFHGYTDFSYGWRYQIPHLASLGYQVITPDMLGYAETDSPAELAEFTKRKLSTDMALLMDQIVPNEQVIVGGHDWGADLAYKLAIWYPNLVKAFFTLVMNDSYKTLGYERQFRGFGYERYFQNETEIYWLLNAVFGGTTANGTSPLSTFTGFNLSLLSTLRPNPLVNSSDMAFYVQNYARTALRGPSNWYRTYHLDWQDELPVAQALAGKRVFNMPSLFIPGTNDPFIPHWTWMEARQYYENITITPVDSGHWVLQEVPDDVNRIVTEWLAGVPA